jgi:radical SAM protein with 4Fe4S-binding SPASM domain
MVKPVSESALIPELQFLWLEITGRCNLICGHCYADSGPQVKHTDALSLQQWTGVIDEAHELGCRAVQFIGGEPTLHPNLMEMIEHADRRGFDLIEVFTNATRVDRSLIGCFKQHRVHVATSFYSADSAVHERITMGPGSWSRTVNGMRAILDAGLPLRVGIIETRHNAGHVQSATTFLESLGVTQIGWDGQRGVGRGVDEPLSIHTGRNAEPMEELCGQCWKGRLCVVPNGDVFPCVFSRSFLMGNASQGLTAILRSQELQKFRSDVRRLEQDRNLVAGCNPDQFCSPYQCYPQTGPCSPACGPVHCQPGSGPCYPAGR